MPDKVCRDCLKRSRDEKWYPFQAVQKVAPGECSFHPVLINWRVKRTLRTLKTWALEVDGYSVALSATCKMPVQLGGGHVHERTARAKLFDYEGPFIDLLVTEGLVDRHEGAPTTLTVTAKGDEFIRQDLLEKEAKGGVENTAHFMRERPE